MIPTAPSPWTKGSYFDLTPRDAAIDMRKEMALALEEMNIGVEYSHHEVAPSQHEIYMRYAYALTMADIVMTYRLAVKEVVLKYGAYATFIPKPAFGINRSGMHVLKSLFKGERNAFFDEKDEYNLSQVAKNYIAGLLKHAPEITAVCNQWGNSYKRLVPGYELPITSPRHGETAPTSSGYRSTDRVEKKPPALSSAPTTPPVTLI